MSDDIGSLEDCYIRKSGTSKKVIGVTDPGIIKTADGATNVYTLDPNSPPIEHYFYCPLQEVTVLEGPYPKFTTQITLDSGHGFVDPDRGALTEDYINIRINDPGNIVLPVRFYQSRIVAVDGDVISLGIPLPFILNTANLINVYRVSVDMNVSATLANPTKFETESNFPDLWELTRMMPVMICDTQPDDGLFGNIPALLNGITFTLDIPGIITETLLNIIDNSEWSATAFDVRYTDRSVPLGSFGVGIRKTFSGRDRWGIVIPLGLVPGQKLYINIQDDLTDLLRFRIKIMGRHKLPPLVVPT